MLVRSTDPGSSAVAVGGLVGVGEVEGTGEVEGAGDAEAVGGVGDGVGRGVAVGVTWGDEGPPPGGLGLAVGPLGVLVTTASVSSASTIAPPIWRAATRLVRVITPRS
jgi:hypothetical protein